MFSSSIHLMLRLPLDFLPYVDTHLIESDNTFDQICFKADTPPPFPFFFPPLKKKWLNSSGSLKICCNGCKY